MIDFSCRKRHRDGTPIVNITSDDLFDELYDKRYIDRHNNINPEKRDDFLSEYPEFTAGLSAGKVKDRNEDEPKAGQDKKSCL